MRLDGIIDVMTDVPPASQQGSPRVSDEFRALRRSRSDRVVAGVLGGLGRRLDIDPVVLRIVTVVLAIFGGVGVLLYVAAWLLVPAEDEEGSVLDHALGRTEEHRSGAVPLAILLTVVGFITGAGIIAGSWDSGVLILLAGIGLVALLRRRDNASTEPAEPADPPEQAWFDQPSTGSYGPVPPTAPVQPDDPGDTPTSGEPGPGQPLAGLPVSGWPEGPDWGTSREPEPVPVEPPAPVAKHRSVLGPITVCVALLAVGVLAVNDVYWASVPMAMYVAVPLGVVALGLLVGAWYGRSRGLIVLGILLAIALVPATWASQWDFENVGDVSRRYTTIADVPTTPVDHGAGTISYDLSALRLTDDDTVPLDIAVGAGDLTVTVPENADVTVKADVGGGSFDIFGKSFDGLGGTFNDVDEGPDGPGGGEIILDVEVGFGNLEVIR